MKIGVTPFIAENISPKNAKSLVIYSGDRKICTIDISRMRPTELGTKLYSFGLIGDIHIGSNGHDIYLNDALTLFENEGCQFCTHAGDITNVGFYSTDDPDTFYPDQFAEYKSVIDSHNNLPVYGVCGNHESYTKSIMENLSELVEYTGTPLYYTLTRDTSADSTSNGGNICNSVVGDDVFIFIGQPSGTPYAFNGIYKSVWTEELDWLESVLELNKNKRCFVYEHLTLTDDAGNPMNIHNAFWGDLESRLFSILNHYKNAIVIHGHSHLDLSEQLNFSYANYTMKNGFKSIHAGAPCGGRVTLDGILQKNAGVNGCGEPTKRGGYIVDVYKNHIILKGYYFSTGNYVPIAQYCIDAPSSFSEL